MKRNIYIAIIALGAALGILGSGLSEAFVAADRPSTIVTDAWAAAKTCVPACTAPESCYCTYKNGATCDDDHVVYGTCSCTCK